ncbi:hypothetical protein VTN02DRAFT_943 [Thermoascus thermophilus]
MGVDGQTKVRGVVFPRLLGPQEDAAGSLSARDEVGDEEGHGRLARSEALGRCGDNGREEGRLKRNGTDAGPERLLEVHDAERPRTPQTSVVRDV